MSRPTVDDILPLSPLQEGILFHALANRSVPALYVAQYVVPVLGVLDTDRLRAAAHAVVGRHPGLRARIRHRGSGQPVQVVVREPELRWTKLDVRGGGPDAASAALEESRHRGVDVDDSTLIRFDLIRDGDESHRLAVTFHHCLIDGWSAAVLIKELTTLYAGTEPAPVVPFRDHLAWVASRDRAAAERAWREALEGAGPTLLAPEAVVEPDTAGPQGEVARTLRAGLSATLTARAREREVTLNTVVQAAWAIVLAHRTGRTDVGFGSTLSGRPADLDGAQDMIGMLVNTVPVWVRTTPDDTLSDVLDQVHRQRVGLMRHDYLGLGDIQRSAGQQDALFDTVVTVDNVPGGGTVCRAGPDGPRFGPAECREMSHYPLTVVVEPGDRLRVRLHYLTGRFTAATVTALAEHLERVLDAISASPDSPLRSVEPCAPGERGRLLAAWTGEPSRLPAEACVHHRFEAQAAARPDHVALVHGAVRVTYGELDARADRLARHLVGLGARRGGWVGIHLERGPALPVAILAVLKAGGCYVLLDPAFPAERVTRCLAETGAAFVVTDSGLARRLRLEPGRPPPCVMCVDTDEAAVAAEAAGGPGVAVDPRDAACVLFTSGSQGRPKGVVAPHRALVGSIVGQPFAPFTADDVVLQCSPVSWDAFAFELFGALFAGATCVLQPGPIPDPSSIVALMAEHRVTVPISRRACSTSCSTSIRACSSTPACCSPAVRRRPCRT